MEEKEAQESPPDPKGEGREEEVRRKLEATLHSAGEFPGAVTAHLKSRDGIRGDLSLASEEQSADSIAGPASEKRYGILGEIARGGMGAIVKLVDNDIRRPVAMKVILGDDVNERVDRFVEEAQVTGQLEHPNIVPVHELGLDPEGKVYFTMKLVKGESLDTIIDAIADKNADAVRKYPLSHLLQIFLKVCDAIAFAHSKGVIHRDLKPENVMVGRFGEVLVMDWGLAKVWEREDMAEEDLVETIRSEKEVGKTLSGEVMGTPSYMPPEQASGKVDLIDERSDVFALGAMLYKILTHEAPYTGRDVGEVLRQAVRCAYKAPRVRSPWNRIPKELQSICLKAMRARREDRYGSVEAMVEDIGAHLDHRPVSAHGSGLLTRFLRFVQRHPAGSLAGGVALILLSLGGALGGVLLQRTEAERAKVREKEALAEAEAARADAASVRAQMAEEARARAEVRATDAEDALKKGRRVSAVLRSAGLELADVVEALRRSMHSAKSIEEKRRIGERYWPRVEAFCATVEGDPASRAAMLAVKGLLRWLAVDTRGAVRLFRESARADPDVAYGPLFEGMIWLTKYLEKQPLPETIVVPLGVRFTEVPPETEEMKRTRERFEAILETVGKKPIWGETSSEEFREVLDGFRAMQRGDMDTAEQGLTQALGVPELTWISREILLARAKVRYVKKDFPGGCEDIDKVLKFCSESQHARFFKGFLWFAEALARGAKGEDPRPAFRNAIREYDEALRLKPNDMVLHSNRSLTYRCLAEAEDERGVDPTESFRRAIEDASAAIRLKPDLADSYLNRGLAHLYFSDWMAGQGRDPRETVRRAIAAFDEALRRDPALLMARNNRAVAYLKMAQTLMGMQEEPREWFEKAVADCDETLRRDPNYLDGYCQRAVTFVVLGDYAFSQRLDPSPIYRKALDDCERALKGDPDLVIAHYYWAVAHRNLAKAAQVFRRDPREDFKRAIEGFKNVLKGTQLAKMYCELGMTYWLFG
ncbi:MAG: protein kinase domain-containing protein, partial [Planctomycetota bacterium]